MATLKYKSVASSWLRSKKRRGISDAAERIWLAILLESDSHGDIEDDVETLLHVCFAGVKGWTEKRVTDAVAELVAAKLLKYMHDEDGREWLEVVDHDKHQSGYLTRKRGAKKELFAGKVRPEAVLGPVVTGTGTGTGTGTTPIGEMPTDPPPTTQSGGEIGAIFDHWKTVFGKIASTKLDGKRRARIKWAKDTYGFAACIESLDGYGSDPWADRKRHHDLTLLFKDAAHFERGLDLAAEKRDGCRGGQSFVTNVIHV